MAKLPEPIEAPLPRGVADFLPATAAKIGYIMDRITHVFQSWGFRRVITPLLEYEDVMGVGLGRHFSGKTFRFDDRYTGRLLVIPPDITPQVARIVATRMPGLPLPHRLYYTGRVLRHAESQSGRSREIFQAGVELIGLDSPEADAEMAAIAVQALKDLGFESFRIALGQVDFYHGIMDASGLSPAVKKKLQTAIRKKDSSAVEHILAEADASADAVREISALPRLFGGKNVLTEAAEVVRNARSRKALENLSAVVEILEHYEVDEYLALDLGEIRGLDYHTGITMEGFVAGVGEAVCGGGRYDNLTGKYGYAAPATGFAFNLLPLLHALEKRPEVEASITRDLLIFNRLQDKKQALRIARVLREQGYSVARDIIKRELADSLTYAKVMNMRYVLVVGSDDGTDGLTLIRTADGVESSINMQDLEAGLSRPDFHPVTEKTTNG